MDADTVTFDSSQITGFDPFYEKKKKQERLRDLKDKYS